jgi:hypothetical protein
MPSDNEYLAEFKQICAEEFTLHGLAADAAGSNMLLAHIFGKAFLAVLEKQRADQTKEKSTKLWKR